MQILFADFRNWRLNSVFSRCFLNGNFYALFNCDFLGRNCEVLAAAGQLTLRGGINTSRPVSRVLSGELPLRDGHSSGTRIAERLEQSTRVAGLKTDLAPRFRALPATPI